jgi:hypothetical protein
MSTDTPPALRSLKSALRSVTSEISTLDRLWNSKSQEWLELQQAINSFLNNHSIRKFTAHFVPAPPSQSEDLKEIKLNLAALSKAVNGLHQKTIPLPQNQLPSHSTKAKGNANSPLPTYANAAASRSTRASLVMNLKGLDFGLDCRPTPAYLTEIFNDALKSSPLHQVHIAATRWTANSNLVITGGHLTTAQQLRNCTEILSKALAEDQSVPDDAPLPHPPTRPNVKWSKVLINGIPTGVQSNRDQAYSPEECHEALVNENPIYASLLVTQKPSWVRPPSSYAVGSSSSIVVAFEDPDGNKAKALFTERYLYAFGARASVKRWKQRPPMPKPTPPSRVVKTPPPPAANWLAGATPTPTQPVPFNPFSPEASAAAGSPQKRKANALSPFHHRAISQASQPSKKQATGPLPERMAEDPPNA